MEHPEWDGFREGRDFAAGGWGAVRGGRRKAQGGEEGVHGRRRSRRGTVLSEGANDHDNDTERN